MLLDVPPLNCLVGEGRGDPRNSPLETEIVEAIYAVSFAIADRLTESRGFDYGVTPLEKLREGTSAQILMKGFSDGARIAAIEQLTMYATSEEYEVSGLYHEIYLTGHQGPDENRRTICRLPVQAPDRGE